MATRQQVSNSITHAIADIITMHGSVLGDLEFNHHVNPAKCLCVRGLAIRRLKKLLKLYPDSDFKDLP